MSKTYVSKNLLIFLGFLLLIPPILIYFGLVVFGDELATTRVSLVCSIAAILCCSKGFNQPNVYLRIASIIVVLIATLIALLNIYQLV
jgi:hypothetical protein